VTYIRVATTAKAQLDPMKVYPILLFALMLLLASSVQAQKMQSGEFLSKNGDYLKVINASQLISNITSYEDVNTYQITNDSIILQGN
jgi:hypothetical protein